MERAAFFWRTSDLGRCTGQFDRIYFGHEFCQRLIPTEAQLDEAIAWAEQRKLSMSLVLPFVTNPGLTQAMKLIGHFTSSPVKEPEIVVNDWGILFELSQRQEKPELVMGRLLTKQKRGPRIMRIKNKVTPDMLNHFQRSNIDVPLYSQYLREHLKVSRVELDNLLQGIIRTSSIPASLYLPYAYVTTTRQCLTARCEQRDRNPRNIQSCGYECFLYGFKLEHPDMPVPLFIRGNTQYFRNDVLPTNLEELKINRLVYLFGIVPGQE